ncbi:hypothetical protein JCM16303_003661 [Sporobolomyces ruberrimus]
MNLMERRQASWSKRNAANKAYPALTSSTFDPQEPSEATARPPLTKGNSFPRSYSTEDQLDLSTGNFDISPNVPSTSSFSPLPLANTPLAHTPLPQSDSNNSFETTTSHFTDARTDFSSPPLYRSNATSPLEGYASLSASPPISTSTPRSISSTTLASSGGTPSPRRASTSRPPLPRKNSARSSIGDLRNSLTSTPSSSQTSRSNGADPSEPERVVRKVPSFTMTPPSHRASSSTPTSSISSALPIASTPSTPQDLSFARPRPTNRAPSLSQAGSTTSSRISMVSENSSSGLRNSQVSFQSPDMTEEGFSCRTSSVYVESEGNHPSRVEGEKEEEPVVEVRQTQPQRRPSLACQGSYGPKPVGIATLHLDTSSIDKHPSPPTGIPPTAALAGLAGLGIGWEEGDLQSNLDELSRYAKSLPSPVPSPLPLQGGQEGEESPLDRWEGSRNGREGNLVVPSVGGGGGESIPPVPPTPNLAASSTSSSETSTPVTNTIRTRSRSASRSRQQQITKKPSLVDLAASSSSSPYFGARSGKNRSEPLPPPPPLPVATSTKGRERERSSTQDSESYLSMDDTDFLETDDEEGSRSFGKSIRFRSFIADSGNRGRVGGDQSIGSLTESSNGYYGVGIGGRKSASGTQSGEAIDGFSGQDLGAALWNSDLARVMVDDEEGEEAVQRILDWSGKPIQMAEVPTNTTHLILARTLTPLLVAPLLNVTIPKLAHNLVVLDISSCGLAEIPSALSSCISLEELDVHGNPLATSTLPSFLGTLTSLLVLIADSCGLSSLPSSLSHLTRLHTLAIRDNRLRAVPSWLSRLDSLEVLLIDGNPLHWQYQNLVQPLLTSLSDSPEQIQQASDRSTTASPMPPALGPVSHSVPASRARSPSSQLLHSSTSSFSIPPGLADSPTVGSFSLTSPDPGSFPASAPPHQISFDELSPPLLDRGEQPLPSPSTIVPSPGPSSLHDAPADSQNGTGGGGTKKSWGRLFKKVSTSRMNLKRPGALEPETRTFSEPVTRAEGSQAEDKSGGLFGSRKTFRKKSSRPPVPQAVAALSTPSTPKSIKRRSFLVLDTYKNSSESASLRQLASPTPPNHQVALRSVLAYLRDLDDLSEDLSLPNIPLDSPSPPLRHSPSLGALSPTPPRVDSPDVRRAQSTRRPLPSRSPRPGSSSRLSEYYEESNDSSSGRATPLPGGTFSPLPGSVGASTGQIKTKNDPVKREAVIKEIVETERTYLKGLEELCAIYVASSAKTVSSNGGKKDPVLPLAERRAVFGNIEAIRDFHRTIFLPDLLSAVRQGGDGIVVAGRVGEVFRQHGSFLKIYSAYVNGFDASLAQIQTWAASSTSGRPSTANGTSGGASSTLFDAASQIGSNLTQSQKKRIKGWMKRCRAHPAHSQISLESYLLLPVQRIPRYRLLLESLSACTPAPPSSDSLAPPSAFLSPRSQLEPHPTLLAAVVEMDLVATTLNESKRETEGRAQLLMWQGRIVNRYKSSLVQPHRTLLRSGKLVLTRSVKRSTTRLESLPPPMATHYSNGSARSRLGLVSMGDGDSRPGTPLVGQAGDGGDEIHTLFTEQSTQELIVLLCTDLLILVKAPPPHLDSDPNAPVELYTVVRLNSGTVEGGVRKAAMAGCGGPGGAGGEGPVSLFGKDEDMLRIKVGTKAILYLQHPTASLPPSTSQTADEAASAKRKRKMEARQWRDAINLQFYINT